MRAGLRFDNLPHHEHRHTTALARVGIFICRTAFRGVVGKLVPLGFRMIATTLEANGDAIVRWDLIRTAVGSRGLFFLAGGELLFGYGLMLNLAPLEFGRVVGL